MLQHLTLFQPSAWDNSIAPINIIHKLENEINNLIDYVNSMEDESVERAKEYTDAQISVINVQIAEFYESFRSISRTLGNMDAHISSVEATNDTRYAEMLSITSALRTYIDETKDYLKNYTDIKTLELKTYLEAQINAIKQLIDDLLNLKTIDGLTGEYKTVREIIGTSISPKVSRRGSNRYSLTWGQICTTTNKGWLSRMSNRYANRINYFAPTWYNFMINCYDYTPTVKATRYAPLINTWGAFCYNTLIYIGEIVHMARQYYTSTDTGLKAQFGYMDLFDKSEWDTYISNGTPIPTINESVDLTTLYDETNDHMSLVWQQFKYSIGVFTGFLAGYGLYSASASANAVLFAGSGDIPYLVQYLLGNLNSYDLTNTFDD